MLLERGDPTCVKMIDFGLSKDFSASQTMSTMSGSVSINIGDSDCLFAALLHRPWGVPTELQFEDRYLVNGRGPLHYVVGESALPWQ